MKRRLITPSLDSKAAAPIKAAEMEKPINEEKPSKPTFPPSKEIMAAIRKRKNLEMLQDPELVDRVRQMPVLFIRVQAALKKRVDAQLNRLDLTISSAGRIALTKWLEEEEAYQRRNF